ncbi:SOS response-associated peptidase [Novosphingobium sp.]|uniref:SOS response-associated peptidase n=1 Tax=Novosphingobium sp. TaxID=1874826 RepID=UPI002FE0A325
MREPVPLAAPCCAPSTPAHCSTSATRVNRHEEICPICNLYRLTTPASAVAALFEADVVAGANLADVVAPSDPGLVLAQGRLTAMTWGFPRQTVSPVDGKALKPKPVNNTRTENLGSRFWRASFVSRRCLVPLSAWAEAAGETGHMTRTWFSPKGCDTFAVAGIWKNSAEWGRVFSMLMVPGHEQMEALNDRMPVILREDDWDVWTQGTPTAAHALCRTWDGRLDVEVTAQPWSNRARPAPSPPPQLSLPL